MDIRNTWGVTNEAVTGIIPKSWLDWSLGTNMDNDPRPSEVHVLAAHGAVTSDSLNSQHNLGKLVNRGRHASHTASLDQPPEMACPPKTENPLGEMEATTFAEVCYRSLQGAGASVCLRVRPTDSFRVILPSEFVAIGRRMGGVEDNVAAS